MGLVDDQILHRDLKRLITFPVVVFLYDAAAMLERIVPIRFNAPDIPAAYKLGIRIEEDLAAVKPVTALRIVRTVHTVPVLDLFDIKPVDYHREHVTDPELFREWDTRKRFLLTVMKQYEFAICRILRKDREVDPGISHDARTERLHAAAAVLYSVKFMSRTLIDSDHILYRL